MVQSRNLKRRLEKIENRLEPEKGKTTRFPLPDGSFIEIPGYWSLFDVLALAMASDKKMDETEQN